MSEAIPDFVKSIDLDDGSRSVFFECDAPPTWKVVEAHGHQPNGYFWEGVANWLISQGRAPEVSMDPEGSMFSAQGTPAELDAFLAALPAAIRAGAALDGVSHVRNERNEER